MSRVEATKHHDCQRETLQRTTSTSIKMDGQVVPTPSSDSAELVDEMEIDPHELPDNKADSVAHLSDEVREQLATVSAQCIFTVKGRQYVKIADLASYPKYPKSSKVWDHGFEAIDLNAHTRYWFCQYCMCAL